MSDSPRFRDSTVLVTGASSGIGRACAARFAAEGARVVLVGRNEERLRETAAAMARAEHCVMAVDLTDEAATKTAFSSLKPSVPQLACVVHAAGVHGLKPLQIESAPSLQSVLDHNLGSLFRVVRLCLAAKLLPSGSSIVALSSQAATRGTAGASAYAAAKGAIESAVRSWSVELSRAGIRVNAVSPGVVNTPMTSRFFSMLTEQHRRDITSRHLLGLGEPDDVAAAVAFLGSKDARWITGIVMPVDGGFSAW